MIRPACALVALLSLLTVGCATPPNAKQDPRDPLERFNRASYAFNDAIDRAVLRPVAKGYRFITPTFLQTGITNFFSNLGQPTVIVNDLLQAKFKPALSDTTRFVLNTTLGLGGLLDPASSVGLDKNDEDLGQTFGKWGVPSGAYLMVPLFGPSTFRDGIGSVGDVFTDPVHYVERDKIRYSLDGLNVIDARKRRLDLDDTLAQTFDKYAFIRNAYLQQREYKVTDGATAPPPVDEDPLVDPEAETPPDTKADPKN